MAVLWVVDVEEIFEVFFGEGILFEGEVLVGSQVVNPEFLGPGFFVGSGFAVEEEDIRFHALGVENAGG